jgi:N-acetylglucosaminyldiphosphoundecaprenol N-acetyl-beta-D-mannosaminyltransferase
VTAESPQAEVIGVEIRGGALDALVADALDAIQRRDRQVVFACANVHSVMLARSDTEFKKALDRATYVVPDGIGLIVAANMRGVSIGPRVTGPDYFDGLNRKLADGGRIFLLGSTPHVLAAMQTRLSREHPALNVCGIYSPPFRDLTSKEDEAIVEAINGKKPDVLWVGMTAPKQEKWIDRNKEYLDVPVLAAVGAVFDFYAGTKRRAPTWMRAWGLEWVYRFLQEPTRMWRRHLISIPQFMALVLVEQFRFTVGAALGRVRACTAKSAEERNRKPR